MDPEEPSRGLLAPSVEQLAAVKVFPLIPSLKKDVIVSRYSVYTPIQSYPLSDAQRTIGMQRHPGILI